MFTSVCVEIWKVLNTYNYYTKTKSTVQGAFHPYIDI